MFLSSLLRKIGSSENKPAVPEKVSDVISSDSVITKTPPINLPSWKDRSVWSSCRLEPSVETQCQEIKDVITGLK